MAELVIANSKAYKINKTMIDEDLVITFNRKQKRASLSLSHVNLANDIIILTPDTPPEQDPRRIIHSKLVHRVNQQLSQ